MSMLEGLGIVQNVQSALDMEAFADYCNRSGGTLSLLLALVKAYLLENLTHPDVQAEKTWSHLESLKSEFPSVEEILVK